MHPLFEIAHLIKGHFRIHPSVSTIYRTFKRYPLNDKRKQYIKRYEKHYPGELIHADTYSLPKTLVTERAKYYLFGALDDCTRLCYLELIDRPKAANVSQAFSRAYKWFSLHGVKPEEVTPQASFIEDLGADSLDTVELVMALEEEFGIEIPDEDAEKMSTVGEAIKYIEEKVSAKQ